MNGDPVNFDDPTGYMPCGGPDGLCITPQALHAQAAIAQQKSAAERAWNAKLRQIRMSMRKWVAQQGVAAFIHGMPSRQLNQYEKYLQGCSWGDESDCGGAGVLSLGGSLRKASQRVLQLRSEGYVDPGAAAPVPFMQDPVVIAALAAPSLVSGAGDLLEAVGAASARVAGNIASRNIAADIAETAARSTTAAVSASAADATASVIRAAETSPFEDLANVRASEGIPQVGEPSGDAFTRARLDVGGKNFYGENAPGVTYERPAGVTYQTMVHAEGDAFGQAADAGVSGGEGELYVDRTPCGFCRSSMAGLARSIGLDSLQVWTPEGLYGTYNSAVDKFLVEP